MRSTWILAIVLAAPVTAQEGTNVLERHCTKCHKLTATLRQRNSRDKWSAIVDDMVARGAEMTDPEIEEVIAYLAKTQGPRVKVNAATAREIAEALELPLDAGTAVVEHRKKGPYKSLDDLKAVPALKGQNLDSKKDRLDFTVS
jgi:DNA uptake protein ComE-like DNA-binding protein